MNHTLEEVAPGAGPSPLFLEKLSMARAALAAGAPRLIGQTTPAVTDVDILQFALNLAYLEAEFDTYATTGAGIDRLGAQAGGTDRHHRLGHGRRNQRRAERLPVSQPGLGRGDGTGV